MLVEFGYSHKICSSDQNAVCHKNDFVRIVSAGLSLHFSCLVFDLEKCESHEIRNLAKSMSWVVNLVKKVGEHSGTLQP